MRLQKGNKAGLCKDDGSRLWQKAFNRQDQPVYLPSAAPDSPISYVQSLGLVSALNRLLGVKTDMVDDSVLIVAWREAATNTLSVRAKF